MFFFIFNYPYIYTTYFKHINTYIEPNDENYTVSEYINRVFIIQYVKCNITTCITRI